VNKICDVCRFDCSDDKFMLDTLPSLAVNIVLSQKTNGTT
jgi:hypothetical protein